MAQLVAGEHGMGVGVDEPGQQGAAVQVDRDRAAERAGRAEPGDLPAAHPDGGAGRKEAAAVEDGPAVEDEFVTVRHC